MIQRTNRRIKLIARNSNHTCNTTRGHIAAAQRDPTECSTNCTFVGRIDIPVEIDVCSNIIGGRIGLPVVMDVVVITISLPL